MAKAPVSAEPSARIEDPQILTLLDKFAKHAEYLRAMTLERVDEVRIVQLALLSRQHVLILGPPGTAKSMLSELQTQLLTGARIFKTLFTTFTQPGEIFGLAPVREMIEGRQRRDTTGMMPDSHVIVIDEVFKGSSMIMNSMLTLMNERKFVNAGTVQECPLISIVASSNELPLEDEGDAQSLRAFYDRFLLRARVRYIQEDSNFQRMLALDENEPAMPEPMTLEELKILQDMACKIVVPVSVRKVMGDIKKQIEAEKIVIGDRRMRLALSVIRAHALMGGRQIASAQDANVLKWILWSDPGEERTKVQKIVMLHANTFEAQAEEQYDAARITYNEVCDRNSHGSDAELKRIIEATAKIQTARAKIGALMDQARDQGLETDHIRDLHIRTNDLAVQLAEKQAREAETRTA